MDSEKVKAIKEALKQNNDNGILYEVDYKKRTCKFIHHEVILTLINELESENERLKIQSEQANAGNVNCSGCKLVEINAVRAFAEKLKEKIVSMKWAREDTNEKLIKQGATIKAIDATLKEFIK